MSRAKPRHEPADPTTQPQHRADDLIIQRRFRTEDSTHAVQQIYAVTYPDHPDRGSESRTYEDAERTALAMAEERKLSVWYEESPPSGKLAFVRSFRDPQ
jgi:hypothetical protein